MMSRLDVTVVILSSIAYNERVLHVILELHVSELVYLFPKPCLNPQPLGLSPHPRFILRLSRVVSLPLISLHRLMYVFIFIVLCLVTLMRPC